MGGDFDATNVADGAVAVITPISLDHVDYLGPDIATIAEKKAASSNQVRRRYSLNSNFPQPRY